MIPARDVAPSRWPGLRFPQMSSPTLCVFAKLHHVMGWELCASSLVPNIHPHSRQMEGFFGLLQVGGVKARGRRTRTISIRGVRVRLFYGTPNRTRRAARRVRTTTEIRAHLDELDEIPSRRTMPRTDIRCHSWRQYPCQSVRDTTRREKATVSRERRQRREENLADDLGLGDDLTTLGISLRIAHPGRFRPPGASREPRAYARAASEEQKPSARAQRP